VSRLDKLVTGNDVRARLVVSEWRRLSSDAGRLRTIVFCVSVAHAEFMTDWLNRAGLLAACVVGSTASDERRRAPQRLLSGELCALVTVDFYNEGIDMPMVDTLLLLRPRKARCCSSSRSAVAGVWRRARRVAWCSTLSANTAPSPGSTACCRA